MDLTQFFFVGEPLDIHQKMMVIGFADLATAYTFYSAAHDIQCGPKRSLSDWYITDRRGVPIQVSPSLEISPCPHWLGVPVDVSGWLS